MTPQNEIRGFSKDEIIEMARQAGLHFLVEPNWMFHEQLEAFAKLVAAKEREACAKVCEKLDAEDDSFYAEFSRASDCAEAIRARGQPRPKEDTTDAE